MTADTAQREPTMEEILASIRRIISEDDKPAEAGGGDVLQLAPEAAPAPPEPAKAAAPPPPPAREPAFEPPVSRRPADDDLMVVEDEIDAAFEEEPAFTAPPPAPEPKPEARPSFRAPAPVAAPLTSLSADDTLVGEPAAAKAAGALGRLMGSMMVQSGVTLDDVVREMLKPMLKEWLDANLPQIVESEVAREIDRIRRMAR